MLRSQFITNPYMSGLDVRGVQALLIAKHFIDTGPLDGVYGPLTANAVKVFQARRGLPQHGVLEQTTFDHLTRG